MWVTPLWDPPLVPLQWSAVIGASLVAAVVDVRSRRIPNWLTGPFFLGGLMWAAGVGGLPGLGDSAIGCVVLALPFVMLFIFAGGGAGDAKLMGAIGAWLGLRNGLVALAWVFLCGGVLAISYTLAKGRFREVGVGIVAMCSALLLRLMGQAEKEQVRQMAEDWRAPISVPYGPAIFAGVCCAAVGKYLWVG